MRTLRRRILIREYDYNQIEYRAKTLYDRVTFTPICRKDLEQEELVLMLKNPENDWDPPWGLEDTISILLWRNKVLLYNQDYIRWRLTDEIDSITIQSRKNTPVSKLGWATFEKDK